MKSFIEFARIDEGFTNLIGDSSTELREKYADQVWTLLQKAYAPIGGIKGSGFSSKADMIYNIPFWKIFTQAGKVIVAVMYKDRNGRKTVALAIDGSRKSKEVLSKIIKESLGVSYGEKSGPLLKYTLKTVGFEKLQPFLIEPKRVERLLGEPIIVPTQTYVDENLDKMDQFFYNHYPKLRPYFYVRKIGPKLLLKISIGTPERAIS
jgi:hypothetical protein